MSYSEYILVRLRGCNDIDPEDRSMDRQFNQLSPNEVFKSVLEWEGIIGYEDFIKNLVLDLFVNGRDQNEKSI